MTAHPRQSYVEHELRLDRLAAIGGEPDRMGRQVEEVPEKEVNMRLALRHPDVASLRRHLIGSGYMERGGGFYRLLPQDRWPSLETTAGA